MEAKSPPSSPRHPGGLVLLSITGPDRPGILAEIATVLTEADFRLVDIQQATLLDLLGLSILVDGGPAGDPVKRLLRAIGGAALALGLSVDAREIGSPEIRGLSSRNLYALTVLSDGLDTATVARLAGTVGAHGANIVTIHRLAEADLSAVDFILDVSATDNLDRLKSELLQLSDATGIDLGLQPENAWRKSKRLVIFDVDSTLMAGEAIDELAAAAGRREEVEELTRRAMDGAIPFESALRERVRLLAGLPLAELERVADRLPLTPGAGETVQVLKELGFRVGAISGGFDLLVEPLARRLGLDHAHANRLVSRDGRLTGELEGRIVDAERKAELLRAIAMDEKIPIEQVVGIGDGANDIPMLQAAGLGIAFGSREKTRRAAHGAIRRNDLRGVLYILGVTGSDVRRLAERRSGTAAPSA